MSLISDVRTGAQRPTLSHLPSDRSDSAGPEAVALAEMAGLNLDDWQQWCLTEALSEASDQQWSAFEVAVIVGRQNGKGSILEARQLAGLFLMHERLQVHTAHEFKTCFEHFLRIVNLIESTPELDKRVARIRRGAGEQAIELKTGERLRFLARSSGSGRGMSGDTVYLDEAFALTPQMMGALLPTLSARPNPQVWYMSSAPMRTSAVLHGVLKRAKEDESPRLFVANWGHEFGTDVEDVDAWYRANPALGIRISEESIRSELDALRSMPEEFARERLGVADPLPEDVRRSPKLPADRWDATLVDDKFAIRPGEITLTYGVTKDGEDASISVGAGNLSSPYVETIEHRPGAGWLPARFVELVQKWDPIAIGCNGAGAAGALVGPVQMALREAGLSIELKQMNSTEYKQACAGWYLDVIEDAVDPDGQPVKGRPRLRRWMDGPLDRAGYDATERTIGQDGGWAWDVRSATVPICSLESGTIARALLPTEVTPDLAPFFAFT